MSHLVLGKQGGLVPGLRRRVGVVGVAVQGPSSHPGHWHKSFALLCQKAGICLWTLGPQPGGSRVPGGAMPLVMWGLEQGFKASL